MASSQNLDNLSNASKKRKGLSDDDEAVDSSWPHFIVISSKNPSENISKISPFVIEKTIKGIAGTVQYVKKLKAGLLIECIRQTQTEQILQIKKIGTVEVTSSPHTSLNQCKGIIRYSHGDLDDLTDEQICEELKSQGVKNVQRFIKKTTNGPVKLNIFLLTFNSTKLPSHIYIGLFRVNVTLYIPNPVRCLKCQKFGHGKAQCRSQEVCFKCGMVGHDGAQCSEDVKCANCDGKHMASSKNCPRYYEEKAIIKIKTVKNISYPDAKKLCTGTLPPTSQMSYAKVAKTSFTHSECQTILTWPEGNSSFKKLPVPSNEKILTPSKKIIEQIKKSRQSTSCQTSSQSSQPSSQSSQSTPKPQTMKQSTASSSSLNQKKKENKNTNRNRSSSESNRYSCLDNEDTETIWGDPMDTTPPDRTRNKSQSSGRKEASGKSNISPIRPP